MRCRTYCLLAALLGRSFFQVMAKMSSKDYMEGWSDKCGYSNRESCNSYQKGYLSIDGHLNVTLAKDELEYWKLRIDNYDFDDEWEKIRAYWSAKVTTEMIELWSESESEL
mmetsp:Transcript_32027/g.63096  ORF Transcript_32027/g.63096 Transcript_32027/m.63096 type:complete len:111 (+) Transcript_32027:54-386(+)